MSELELSSLKYPPLEKLSNLANKAQNNAEGIEQFIKILPKYEAKVNEVMQDRINEKTEEKAIPTNATPSKNIIPIFTGNGRAEQAVRQRAAINARTQMASEGFER